MKTTHIILQENINSKSVQVDLIPITSDDKRKLDSPTEEEKTQLSDHMMFYLQGIFSQFATNEITDDSGFPKRSVFRLVLVKGI